MQGKIKQNCINLIFTICITCLAFWIGFTSKIYFSSKASSFNKVLEYKLSQYKIKIIEDDVNLKSIQSFNSDQDFTGYNKTPKTSLQTISYNINETPKEEENFIIPTEEIKQNPLFSGNYSQIGIFANKEGAEEVIKILALKGILDANFTSYIETRQIKSKTFYLVEIGVFQSPELAQNFCDKLKRIQIACSIIGVD
jgi:hypothetical protein